MSTHLNANANVSLNSNANANENAIFQERMQMQMFWGRIQMQMFWLYITNALISNVWFYINVLFYFEKKQRNLYKHILNLFNKYSSILL